MGHIGHKMQVQWRWGFYSQGIQEYKQNTKPIRNLFYCTVSLGILKGTLYNIIIMYNYQLSLYTLTEEYWTSLCILPFSISVVDGANRRRLRHWSGVDKVVFYLYSGCRTSHRRGFIKHGFIPSSLRSRTNYKQRQFTTWMTLATPGQHGPDKSQAEDKGILG